MANQIQKSNLAKIKDELLGSGCIKLFKDAIPEVLGEHAEKAAERFAKLAYTAVSQSPALQKCHPKSIAKAASIAASLNLDIDPRGLAYLVPFKDQAVFIIGYQGLMELAYRTGQVKSFSGSVIYESEKDKIAVTREDGRLHVIHPFSWEAPKGEVIGAYVTAEVEGYGSRTCLLRKDEIEFYRGKSLCPNSPAWKQFYNAMALKTCVRQLCKWLPKSVTKEIQTGLIAEDNQRKFVEAVELKEKEIAEKSGSEVVENPLDETAQLPEPEEGWMED
jgi:recombination protein RecT